MQIPASNFNKQKVATVNKLPSKTGTRTVGLLNTVKGNFIALKYKTQIIDENRGVYDIEVTNYVDTRTFRERQVVPSLLSMAQ